MSKRRQKKRHSFLPRALHHSSSKPGLLEADFRVNFDTILDSWSRFKESLATARSGVEAKKLKNIFPTLFQVNQDIIAAENVHFGSLKNKKPNLLYIDINKIEGNAKLNRYDKEKLKTIINYLKYNEEEDKCSKITKRKLKNKPTSTAQKNKRLNKNKSVTKLTKNKDAKMVKKTPTKNKRKYENFKCKRCSRNLKEMSSTIKRKQRNATTSIEKSKERMLQRFVEMDPLAYGDTLRRDVLGIRESSGSLSTIFRRSRNVNIKNIEFKYVNPTYVVQYNTNGSEEQLPQESYGRDRFYSSAALEAHLGQRPCPDYHHKESWNSQIRKKSDAFHYDLSHPHIVGGVPDKTLRQSQAAPHPPGLEDEVFVTDFENSDSAQKSTTVAPSEDFRKWANDPYVHYVTVMRNDRESVDLEEPPKKASKKKESTCKTITEFVRKCFCLPVDDMSDSSFVQVESPMKMMTKEDYLKGYKIGKSPSKLFKKSPVLGRSQQNNERRTRSKLKRVNFDLEPENVDVVNGRNTQ